MYMLVRHNGLGSELVGSLCRCRLTYGSPICWLLNRADEMTPEYSANLE